MSSTRSRRSDKAAGRRRRSAAAKRVIRKPLPSAALALELLEDRTLLSIGGAPLHVIAAGATPAAVGPTPSTTPSPAQGTGPYANVQVNNPNADKTGQDTQSETSIVLGANSNPVVGFNDSGSYITNPQFTGYAYSTNGGATFTDAGTLPLSANGDAGDPSLARDTTSGVIYFAALMINGTGEQVFRSYDNGVTFTAPVNAVPNFNPGDFLDKEWITVDNDPGPGQGTVYLTFTDFGADDNGVYITHSTDGGNTWTTPLSLGGSQGSYVTVGPNHAVYVFYLDVNSSDTAYQISMRKSTDGGNTFAPAVDVAPIKSLGVNGDLGLTVSKTDSTPFRSNTFPQAVVTSSAIYVTFDDVGVAPGDKADVYFTESTNGGTTWTARQRLNTDNTTTDQWQPSMAITPDGDQLGVFWYDRRNDTQNDALIDRYGVIGTVNGSSVTWGPNIRVTDTSFPAAVNQDPVVNPTYMGDYDVTVADNNYFYVPWGDNRLGDSFHQFQPDVRLAKIPTEAVTTPTFILDESSYSVGSSAGSITITVDLLGTDSGTETVNYGTTNGTAVAGTDYGATSGTLTFSPGDQQHSFTIPIYNDANVTSASFTVSLSAPTGGAVLGSPSSALVNILEDEYGQIQFNAASYTVFEDAGNITITVSRTNGADGGDTVAYTTRDGTAFSGTDYAATSGVLTFNPGQTQATFSVPILDDINSESAKVFNLSLDPPVGNAAPGQPGTAQVYIEPDNSGVIQFSQPTYSVDENAGVATITVTRTSNSPSGNLNGTATVVYSTSDGTATSTQDYHATTGTLTFAPGTSTETMTFLIPIVDDGPGPVDQTVNLSLGAVGGGAVLGSQATALLTIEETQFGQVQFAQASYNGKDNAGTATILLSRTGGAEGTVTVNYATSDGTAKAGTDYQASAGAVTFLPGMTTASFTVSIINDNAPVNQTVNLTLSGPGGGATLGSPTSAVLTIISTDYGAISFAQPTYSADDSAGVAVITVGRSGAAGAVTVNYATSDGTDTAGVNYVAAHGTLSFEPGQLSQAFTIPLLSTGDAASDGSVNLTLSQAGGGATLGSLTSAVLTIQQTPMGQFEFYTGSVVTNSTAGSVSVRVIRTGGADDTITVPYSTANGSAISGADYVSTSGTLTFATGESSEFITIPILGDAAGSGRSFSLSLGTPSGGTLGSPATAQITLEATTPIPATQQVLDVLAGSGSSDPEGFTNVNGTLFFTADDGVLGRELWESNGTAVGTHLVKDIDPGQVSSDPNYLTNVNGTLYFAADDSAHGRELWKSNGTAAGTVMVDDINPGPASSNPTDLVNMNGTLFFAANDGSDGTQLWRSGGTAGSTVMVDALNPGGVGSYPSELTNMSGTLFFTAYTPSTGYELFRSDGTAAGTSLVLDIRPGYYEPGAPYSSQPYDLTNVNGTLYFAANDGIHGTQLWESGGSANNTFMVDDINPGYSYVGYVQTPLNSDPHDLLNMNGTLYFAATTAQTGTELWRTNGTVSSTIMVTDIEPNNGGADPSWLTNVNGTLFFAAEDAVHGTELWDSTGTSAGTNLVLDIHPGLGDSDPAQLTNVDGILYFAANDGTHGTELWRSNGTAAGTVMVSDIDPGAGSSDPSYLTSLGSVLYFAASDGGTGTEMWRVNDQPPTINVPGTQSVTGSSLVLSSTGGNGLSITDPTAGDQPLQVSLTATNGLLNLSGTSGLTFSVGGGSGVAAMTFGGSLSAINAALNGLTFTPSAGPGNPASVQIGVNDLGGSGFGGPLSASGAVTINLTGNDPADPVGELAAVPGSSSTLFAVNATHTLYRYTSSGWSPLGAGIASITTATEASGNVVVYAVTQDEGLYRFSNATGWQQIGAPGTVHSASAGTDASGLANVFVLTASNALYEYDPQAGWFALGAANSILSMSGTSQGRVAVVTADHSIFEYDPHFGWLRLTSAGFADSVQAVTQSSGLLALFVMTPGNVLYEYQQNGAWTGLGRGIGSYSAGTDAQGNANVFVLTSSTDVFYEYSVSAGWQQLQPAGAVSTMSAAASDRAFIAMADGEVFSDSEASGLAALSSTGFLSQ